MKITSQIHVDDSHFGSLFKSFLQPSHLQFYLWETESDSLTDRKTHCCCLKKEKSDKCDEMTTYTSILGDLIAPINKRYPFLGIILR